MLLLLTDFSVTRTIQTRQDGSNNKNSSGEIKAFFVPCTSFVSIPRVALRRKIELRWSAAGYSSSNLGTTNHTIWTPSRWRTCTDDRGPEHSNICTNRTVPTQRHAGGVQERGPDSCPRSALVSAWPHLLRLESVRYGYPNLSAIS